MKKGGIMNPRIVIRAAGSTILMMLLSACLAFAQIPLQGLAVDHEGSAVWDADGSGPDPAGYGHIHPFGYGSVRYYSASRDYKDIDPDPGASLCHFLDGISGFPLFEQSLVDHGFSAGQVKVKINRSDVNGDVEGEDWFTFIDQHVFNRYDADFLVELDGEPMISGYGNYYMTSYKEGSGDTWKVTSSFCNPCDASASSSPQVQDVAQAFLEDMDGEMLRFVLEDVRSTGVFFSGNGRVDGLFFEIYSGYIEKGMPMLPFTGLAADREGLAVWDANGTGPEPEAYGHTFNYNGTWWSMAYYTASPDYDNIDPDPDAALCHFLDGGKGFLNLEVQLEYRGYTFDQLKVKAGISTLGNDVEGIDWGLDGNIHWYRHYGTPVTIEIAGEPILEYSIDTNYSKQDLDVPEEGWWSFSTLSPVKDVSAYASPDAQFVAGSLLKDIGGQHVGTYMEGSPSGPFQGNGRDGVMQQVNDGYLTVGEGHGTFIGPGDVSGTWEAENSPYMVDGDLVVPNGQTLSIDPGVRVAFRGPYHILVEGSVNAQGTAGEHIVFSHSNPTVRWDGLDYDNTPVTNDTSVFDHCIFEYGYAQGTEPFNSGGAVAAMNFDDLVFSNCIFQYNCADQPGENYNPTGGAIALWNSDAFIQNCIFRYNHSDSAAGALFAYEYSKPIISGCLFYDNTTDWWAGAIGYYQHSSGILLNSTIAGNSADVGGGLAFYDYSSPEIINTILWDNQAVEGSQVYLVGSDCLAGFYYCDIEEGDAGFGGAPFLGDYLFNLMEDPDFIDDPDWPYLISENSPCFNMGTPDTSHWYFPEYLSGTCLCGNPRICEGRIDIGSYEVKIVGIAENQLNGGGLSVQPNPFTASVQLTFELRQAAYVLVEIYDPAGVKMATLTDRLLQQGSHRIDWDARQLSTGLYFCRLQVGDDVVTRKIVKFN
jgi:hypothetical protein